MPAVSSDPHATVPSSLDSRTAAAAEEVALMARVVKEADDAALRSLYRRYESRVYGLGLRLLGDRGLAEEMLQETFVRLWRSAGRFDPERGSVATFTFTLARRAAVDLRRRPSSRPLEGEREREGFTDAEVDDALAAITVRDAMNALRPSHREVLELIYDHDLRQVDVAERLGIPLGTVKTRVFHALRALKVALGERGLDG